MTPTNTITVQLTGLTPTQYAGLYQMLHTETAATPTKAKRAKKSAPEPTVDEDEDEDFGKKTLKKKDLSEDDEDEEELEASDDEEADDEESDNEESDEDAEDTDEPSITFEELKAAVNKLGEKRPDEMRVILSSFNIKTPKELSSVKNEKYWEPIYRKVMVKLKATKKAKK